MAASFAVDASKVEAGAAAVVTAFPEMA
jgi:hypothetical protein